VLLFPALLVRVLRIIVLENFELIPVLKLEPFRFAAEDRSAPSGIYEDVPEDWYRYWLESLADSGITGLMPVERGSWHVPTSEFTGPVLLGRVLEVIFQNLSEIGFSIDLDCLPLDGGLVLRCQSQNVLIEPGCCGDLGNVASWRKVVGYRQAEWHPLWIGHPSLSALYRAPRLIISSPHDAEDLRHAGPFARTNFKSLLRPRRSNWSDLLDKSRGPYHQTARSNLG
jgi:hypothetical protein